MTVGEKSDRSVAIPLRGLWLCLIGGFIGLRGLIAWITGRPPWIATLVAGLPPMMPNTALALILIASAVVLRHVLRPGTTARALSHLAAAGALVIGAGTLIEYAFATDLHLLRITSTLVRNLMDMPPGPSSAATALALTFLAAAVLLLDARRAASVRPSEVLVLCAALTAFTGLTGIIFGAAPLYREARTPTLGLSVATGVSVLLISVGLLRGLARGGAMRVAASPGPGGALIRRLALPVILLPIALGLVVTRIAVTQGISASAVPVAILATAMTALSLGMLLVSALPLNRAHEALETTLAQNSELIERAPDGIFVADLEGRYTEVNEAGCRLLGRTREEILSKTIVDLIPPDDVARLWSSREALLRGSAFVEEWTLLRRDGTRVPVEISAKILPDGRWQGFVRDISERKRLEREAEVASEQLRESEERFRLAMDEAPIGMSLTNIDRRIFRVNRALCEILGYSAEELTGMTLKEITHPDDAESGLAIVGQLLRGEIERYQVEKRYIRKDGAIVDARLSGSILRDRSGKPLHFIGQVEDITARKRLDDELRLSEAKATGILSISGDAIISTDDEQRITQFNEGAEKIFGYTKAEAIGAPLDMLLPERFRGAHRSHVAAFAGSPGVSRRMGARASAIVGRRKNGEEFPADAAISRLEVGGTRVLTAAVRDFTEQKRIENEQRLFAEIGSALATTLEYEETASRIAEAVVQGFSDFCIVDLVDGTGEVRRISVDSRQPAHDWICEAIRKIPAGQPRPSLIEWVLEWRQARVIQRPTQDDIDGLSYNDEHRRALQAMQAQSLMVMPLMARGQLLGALSFMSVGPFFVDPRADLRIGQEIAHRAALAIDNSRLYREAQRATQVRDEVLGIVAHDLRNPLSMVLMEARLLGDASYKPERRSAQPGERIHRAAMRMSRLIQDLLDVTRLEAGRLTLAPSATPPAQVAGDAAEAQRALASSVSLDLRLELPPDLPSILADRDRLLQVFENLIGNAIKFTPPNGLISVGASSLEGHVCFWVRDTGPGIPLEDQPHLYDRFWQARTARHGGAGLGLPIVKGIIEAHGGHLWVESEPGSGTTFYFTIPTTAQSLSPSLV